MIKDKSIYNMIVSIITTTTIPVLLVLTVIFQAIKGNVLGVVFLPIFFVFLISYFVIKAIYYGYDDSSGKEVFYRISNVLFELSLSVVYTYFVLTICGYSKWILFGFGLLLIIINIFFSSFNILDEIKYLLFLFIIYIMSYSFISICGFNFISIIGISSIVFLYITSILGKILKNKIILSFDLLSVLSFGLFLILM